MSFTDFQNVFLNNTKFKTLYLIYNLTEISNISIGFFSNLIGIEIKKQ